MFDIVTTLQKWILESEDIALATVISTWGSSPRATGAKMVIVSNGESVGSVSGGCVEGAVITSGMEVIKTGQPQLLHYGISDETAWNVGLSCGGEIDIFVRLIDWSIIKKLISHWESGERVFNIVAIQGPKEIIGKEILVLSGGDVVQSQTSHRYNEELIKIANSILMQRKFPESPFRLDLALGAGYFIDVIKPRPTLVIIGGVHIAIALDTFARTLGYQTIIIDPRVSFGNAERFPLAGKIFHSWPEGAFKQLTLTEETAIVVLTHDPKIDDPALELAVKSRAFYIGALGSKATHRNRLERLHENGLSNQSLGKIKGPIGLDIGGKTPEEIALAIMAEIVQTRSQIGFIHNSS